MEVKSKKRIRYTVEILIQKSIQIHHDKFIYDEITENHINNGVHSRIPLKCTRCGNKWVTTINIHIHSKSGCPKCAKKSKWTLENFIIEAEKLNGKNFDYSDILSSDITNRDSRISILCLNCDKKWISTIHGHINNKSGCPNCPRICDWTYDRFLIKAIEIHGCEKYNYSLITKDDIKGRDSKVPVICNSCDYNWNPTIGNHINMESGCPNCHGHAPLTYDRFIKKTIDINGVDRYDYSLITEDHIKGGWNKITVICKTCNNNWDTTVALHIYDKSGCPKCKFSKGEMKCFEYLNNITMELTTQKILQNLPNKRYDFAFEYQNVSYILEFDGYQHFSFIEFFHKNFKVFEQNQHVDIIKTLTAIKEGYNIIRIDYRSIDDIKYHIDKALELKHLIYVTNGELYRHILDSVIEMYPRLSVIDVPIIK